MLNTLLFLSPGDITLILIAALVLFGGKKLPELARGLGQGIKEFKDATEGSKTDTTNQTPPPPPAPPVYQAPPATPPVQQTPPPAAGHGSDLPDYTPVNQTHPPAQQ